MCVCVYPPWRESYFSHKAFVLSILFSGDPWNINKSSSAYRIPRKQILKCYQSDDKSCFLKCDQLIIHFSWLGSRWIFVCRRMWPREDTLCLRVCLQDPQLQPGIAHVPIGGSSHTARRVPSLFRIIIQYLCCPPTQVFFEEILNREINLSLEKSFNMFCVSLS